MINLRIKPIFRIYFNMISYQKVYFTHKESYPLLIDFMIFRGVQEDKFQNNICSKSFLDSINISIYYLSKIGIYFNSISLINLTLFFETILITLFKLTNYIAILCF